MTVKLMVKVFGFSLLAFDLVIMSQFGVEQFIESWLDSVKRKEKYHQHQQQQQQPKDYTEAVNKKKKKLKHHYEIRIFEI